jgi:hypothetical protein
MKKIFLVSAMLILQLCTGLAQEGKTPGADKVPAESGQVPPVVLERFTREYPGISGTWAKDGDNYRVEFVDPQSHLGHIIVYDRNGDVIRRESELEGPGQPNALNQYFQRNFPGEQLKTWAVKEKDGTVSYYTQRNNEVLRFDDKGNPAPAAKQPDKTGPHGKTGNR